jgi:hypothetical protein
LGQSRLLRGLAHAFRLVEHLFVADAALLPSEILTTLAFGIEP